MDIRQNISEGVKGVKANKLGAVLTSIIIAIGIMALVGVLTAIDSLKASIDTSFSSLGANTFDLKDKRGNRGTREGIQEKSFKKIELTEMQEFQRRFDGFSTLHTSLTGAAEVKRFSKKTNPNINVTGVDENYMVIRDYNIEKGRNFTENDIRYNSINVIVGPEIVKGLFDEREDPLNEFITFFGSRFRIIGVLESKGGFGSNTWADRTIFVPIGTAIRLAPWSLSYTVTANIGDPSKTETVIGEATGLMRRIRGDQLGQEDSFELKRNITVAEELDQISGMLKLGGAIICAFILLGACIGLMNNMLVAVTERTREIGVRKAIGATPMKIRLQFLAEACIICLLGGFLGVMLGILIGNVVSLIIGSGKFVIPWEWVFGGLLVCVIVGVISGLYPAVKASRLDPIESLRYE